MALRTKTIEYAFTQRDTSLAAATRHEFAAVTLGIPETGSRTFRSVIVEVTARQVDAVSVNLTSWLIGIGLGAVAFSDVSVAQVIDDNNEHGAWVFRRDVVSYFAANFGAGASQTCQVAVQFGAVAAINVTARLIITYEYEDSTATTRVKTVRIPIESSTGLLGDVLAELGTNQIPALDTFLPEASKTYRDIFFEVDANEASVSTTDFQLGLALDAEGEALDGVHEQALNSSCHYRRIWKRTNMNPAVTHAFMARSTLASRFNLLGAILVVTYEYDHAASTTIMNSLVLPVVEESGAFGGSVAGDASRARIRFLVEEPATITLRQSGLYLSFLEGGSVGTINFSAGAQAYRAYTHTAGTDIAGQYSLLQRIDSGGAQGAGIVLARGENTLTVDWYRTAAGSAIGTAMTGAMILNYTSGKHASGDGVHAHSTWWSIGDTSNGGSGVRVREFAAVAPNVPEASYWVVGVGFDTAQMSMDFDANLTFSAELLAGEGAEDGWRDLHALVENGDGAIKAVRAMLLATGAFDRHPTDPDPERMAIESARKYRAYGLIEMWTAPAMVLTYHAITRTVSGTISGFSGDGSGIAVDFYRVDTHERVLRLTSAAGGTLSGTWYDDTVQLKSETQQDATHVGRSANGLAT